MDRISLGSPCLRNPASSSCHPSIAQPSSRYHDAARDDFETHLLATRARSLKGSGSVHLSRTPAPQSPIQEKNLSLGSSKLGSLFPPFPHTKGIPETLHDKKTIMWKQEVGHCAPLERWDVGSNKLLPVIPCSPRHSENWVPARSGPLQSYHIHSFLLSHMQDIHSSITKHIGPGLHTQPHHGLLWREDVPSVFMFSHRHISDMYEIGT